MWKELKKVPESKWTYTKQMKRLSRIYVLMLRCNHERKLTELLGAFIMVLRLKNVMKSPKS